MYEFELEFDDERELQLVPWQMTVALLSSVWCSSSYSLDEWMNELTASAKSQVNQEVLECPPEADEMFKYSPGE